MTHADAFRAAILERPDDDGPRLLFADWLEEHGGESARAEFIRVQCALAANGCVDDWCERLHKDGRIGRKCPTADECDALRRRERELLDAPANPNGNRKERLSNRIRWGWITTGFYGEWTFRRGFIEKATCTANAWLKHADAIVKAAPVREVTLTTQPKWERSPIGYGYGRLVGRKKIESLGCIVGETNDSLLIRKLLAAEWPNIKFTLPTHEKSFRRDETSWRRLQDIAPRPPRDTGFLINSIP